MECRNCTESLTALMDGELDEEETGIVRTHLRACSGCEAEYRSLLYSYELVSKGRLIESGASAWMGIESRIRNSKEGRSFLRNLFFPRVWLPITAIAALILFTSFLFLFVPSHSGSVAMHKALDRYVQERNREFESKGVYMNQGVGTVRFMHYNPFAEKKLRRTENPFKAE